MDERFDEAYYRKWYGTRPVQTAARIGQLADATLSLAKWWGIPVRSVLDVGAGPGWWGRHLATRHPKVRYAGVDVSAHASARYGHQCRDIATWTPPRQFDLVVCQGTLHYLDDTSCTKAIANLAAAVRGLALLEIPTSNDLDDGTIVASASDLDAYWRPAAWYRRRLRRHFTELGCGLHVPIDSPHRFYALERGR
jgi:SAM-dependent methyltransferase